jgi:hypothetical protein
MARRFSRLNKALSYLRKPGAVDGSGNYTPSSEQATEPPAGSVLAIFKNRKEINYKGKSGNVLATAEGLIYPFGIKYEVADADSSGSAHKIKYNRSITTGSDGRTNVSQTLSFDPPGSAASGGAGALDSARFNVYAIAANMVQAFDAGEKPARAVVRKSVGVSASGASAKTIKSEITGMSYKVRQYSTSLTHPFGRNMSSATNELAEIQKMIKVYVKTKNTDTIKYGVSFLPENIKV